MEKLNFHPEIISECPPNDAVPASGSIYRKVDKIPVRNSDFLSDVERGAKNIDSNNCQCWGCSVWVDEEAVELALDLFPYWRKKYIVVGIVNGSDGVLKMTPAKNQPRHHTFWKVHGKDVSQNFHPHRRPSGT